jgi:hypothetical protein
MMTPDGRKLTMTDQNQEEGFAILDLEACTDQGCQLIPVPGIPRWSPNGSHALLEVVDRSENFRIIGLARIDNTGQYIELSEPGFSPFWFSDEAYGFVKFGEQAGIYSAPVATDEPRLELDQDTLIQAFPEDQRPNSLIIQAVTPNPANRNILAVTS